tara:strand:- start:9 stop:242 length:234 start_codon:yes stop_codon:yes gene_type:complete
MIRFIQQFYAVAVVTVISTFVSIPAEACAVCFGGENDNRWAFIGTTALLTFLPLIIFFTGVAWFRKRVTEHAESVEN